MTNGILEHVADPLFCKCDKLLKIWNEVKKAGGKTLQRGAKFRLRILLDITWISFGVRNCDTYLVIFLQFMGPKL